MFNEENWFTIVQKIHEISKGSLNATLDISQLVQALPEIPTEDINDVLLYMYDKGTITGPKPIVLHGVKCVKLFKITTTLIDIITEAKIVTQYQESNASTKKGKSTEIAYQKPSLDEIFGDVIAISVDLRSSTKFKHEFPQIGGWEVIIRQLLRIKEWILSFNSDLKYHNFTGDGYILLVNFKIGLVNMLEDTNSAVSLLNLLNDLEKIREEQLTKTVLSRSEFENENHLTLTAPRIAIHKSIDKIKSLNGDCIGPDIDYVARLNDPKIKDHYDKNNYYFIMENNIKRIVYSPIFISEEISTYFKNKIFLGEMEAKGILYKDTKVYLHEKSPKY